MKLREAEALAGVISKVYARAVTGREVRSWSARQRRRVRKYVQSDKRQKKYPYFARKRPQLPAVLR
jgi:hypothetical protein